MVVVVIVVKRYNTVDTEALRIMLSIFLVVVERKGKRVYRIERPFLTWWLLRKKNVPIDEDEDKDCR